MPALSWIAFALLGAPAVEARFEQVHPAPGGEARAAAFERSPGCERAVVLLQGLKLHPFSARNATRAELHSWQRPGSAMVEAMRSEADVFAFAYGQTVPLEEIACLEVLAQGLAAVKALGYPQLVLVGHSAGGLIARHFVEDCPGAGVTKVIQVCSPNTGSVCAGAEWTVRANQEPFLRSLTRAWRRQILLERAGKEIPPALEFVCVIADGAGIGDWVVADHSQWPVDLRAEGVPAERLIATHATIFTRRGARACAELVARPLPRWSPEEVAAYEERFLARPGSRSPKRKR
jgi:hypothetical protein